MVTNLMDGIDEYSIPTLEHIRTFPHTIVHNVPIQVSITLESGWIVTGGDDGFARIYDGRNGFFLQRIDQGTGEFTCHF
jgi:hypothetical protein